MIYFNNPGTFDLRGMLTMGLSGKENTNAIGFFGTGFKYALAVILRNGGKLTVTNDGNNNQIHFFSQHEDFRGSTHDMVYYQINDEPAHLAGFTTHLGTNWKIWQAYRELRCNAEDELGQVYNSDPRLEGVTISVELAAMDEVHSESHKYFLADNRLGEPVFQSNRMQAFESQRIQGVFYKGVLVFDNFMSEQYTTRFVYNFINCHIPLSEERVLQNGLSAIRTILQEELQQSDDEQFARSVMRTTRNESLYEHTLLLYAGEKIGNGFLTGIKRLHKAGKLADNGIDLLQRLEPETEKYEAVSLSSLERNKMTKALEMLKRAGYPIDNYEIVITESLGEGVMGRAMDNKIYLSKLPFSMGTKQVASTLLEEYAHLDTGYGDHSYGLQNWLFDQILTRIEHEFEMPF